VAFSQPLAGPQRSGSRSPRAGDAGVDALAMHGIVKRFPGVLANDHTDFEAAPGEIHALLGENGAGKTTLMHILTGLYRPDEGEIRLHGTPVSFSSPRDALDAGVSMVHQHFRLVDRFTVAENIMLGDTHGSGRRLFVNPHGVEREVRELGERYSLPVDPHAFVWQLSIGEQQRIEILNALYQEARILILDEPTSVLTPQEAEALFVTLRRIAEEGRTVIFISHKLREVLAVSDRITILRGGRNISTLDSRHASPTSLASLMVGHDIGVVTRPSSGCAQGPAGLELEDVWVDGDRGAPAVKNVTLTVHAGEIVAVAGVSGNGQEELGEAIAGLRPAARGSIRVGGRAIKNGDPRAAFDAGIAYVPGDRLGTGVAPSLPVAMNLALRTYRHDAIGPLLRLGHLRRRADELIKRYDIKVPDTRVETRTLSGGNLQKLVLAREFSSSPKVLLTVSPTHGLDVAATETVHRHLLAAADHGIAVLLISEDLDEILSLNDKIFVIYAGRLSAVDDRGDVDEIGLRMAGATP
jgi:general nucleoside transport system ATP-binding protein